MNNNYVLQTYTYSWENHYCHAMHLQSALSEIAPDKTFDFNTFLSRYSSIVYKPLLVYLYMDREKLKGFGQRNFNDMMALQYQAGDLENNGENLLSRFESKVETFLVSLGDIEGFDYEVAKSHYESLNVNEANAYLHVRGHNLYHTVLSLGSHLSSRFEETLLKGVETTGYWEIEQCRDDIMSI